MARADGRMPQHDLGELVGRVELTLVLDERPTDPSSRWLAGQPLA